MTKTYTYRDVTVPIIGDVVCKVRAVVYPPSSWSHGTHTLVITAMFLNLATGDSRAGTILVNELDKYATLEEAIEAADGYLVQTEEKDNGEACELYPDSLRIVFRSIWTNTDKHVEPYYDPFNPAPGLTMWDDVLDEDLPEESTFHEGEDKFVTEWNRSTQRFMKRRVR